MPHVSPVLRSPLTTRACAAYLGFTSEWIRQAIEAGVVVDGLRIRLEAETLHVGRRRRYRVHVDRFGAFLAAIGWKRLPIAAEDRRLRSTATLRHACVCR